MPFIVPVLEFNSTLFFWWVYILAKDICSLKKNTTQNLDYIQKHHSDNISYITHNFWSEKNYVLLFLNETEQQQNQSLEDSSPFSTHKDPEQSVPMLT